MNGVALKCYDRLVRLKTIPLPGDAGGTIQIDALEPELSET